MAVDRKISELPIATSAGASDVVPLVQSGATKQISIGNLLPNANYAERYGASGDGVTNDAAALIAANTALTIIGGELRFAAGKVYRVSSNVTFDSDVSLIFEDGALLSIDAGKTVTAPGPVISLGGLPYTGAGTFTADYAFIHMSPGGSLGIGTTDANPHAGDDGTTTRCITVRAATSPLFVGVTRRTPGAGETIVSFEGYTDQQTAPHDELMAVRGIMEGATAGQRGGRIGFLTKDNAGTDFFERMSLHDHGDLLLGCTANGGVSTANRTGQASGHTVLTISGTTQHGVIELATNVADADALVTGELIGVSNNNSGGVGDKRIAMLQIVTDGTTANDRGGAYVVYTKLDGGVLTERLRINQAGLVTLGDITISGTFKMSGAKFIRNTNDVLALQSDTSHVDMYAANTLVARFPATGSCLTLNAGTTSRSSLRIPHGSAPTSPVDGDIWTTTAGLYVRINGSTVGPLS